MFIPSVVSATAFVGALLNVILALALSPFATKSQIKPPLSAAELGFFPDQFMHMIVHHKQTLLMSSLIVFIVVFISRAIEHMFFPHCPFKDDEATGRETVN